jgi:hypothetical protein
MYETEPIEAYIQLRDKIIHLFESGKLIQKTYSEALDFNRITFAKRIKDKSFSPEELMAIVRKINEEFK